MNNKINTKNKIIDITVDIIAREGLKNTTAGNIAKNGDLNKSIIFYYFKNIDELLYESLIFCIKNTLPILNDNFTDYENIGDYLSNSIKNIIEDNKKVIYLKVILSFAHQNIFLENDLKELRAVIIDDLFKYLEDAILYYKKIPLTNDEIETISSLSITTFNGLGILLLSSGANDKFTRNWDLHSRLINDYIS